MGALFLCIHGKMGHLYLNDDDGVKIKVMHIITGFILAGLAGKLKKDPALQGIPQLKTGPVQLVHVLPGRIRFLIPSLCGKGVKEQTWLKPMRQLKGIVSVTFSPVTGSVLIAYEPGVLHPPQLFHVLVHLLGLEAELAKAPSPLILREIKSMGESLNRVVYDETHGIMDLWAAGVILLILLGGKKVIEGGKAAFPAGLTLLWWALSAVRK